MSKQMINAARMRLRKGNTGNNKAWETGLRDAGQYFVPVGDPLRGIFTPFKTPMAPTARLARIKRTVRDSPASYPLKGMNS